MVLGIGLVVVTAQGAIADPGAPASGFTPQTLGPDLEGAELDADGAGGLYVAAVDTGERPHALVVRRYLPDGSPDRGWATDGEFARIFDAGEGGPASVVEVIGIVVAGDGSAFVAVGVDDDFLVHVVKLEPSGALAGDFGAGSGEVVASLGAAEPFAMALDSVEGHVWVAGTGGPAAPVGTRYFKVDSGDGRVLVQWWHNADLMSFIDSTDMVPHPDGGMAFIGLIEDGAPGTGGTFLARVDQRGGGMVESFGSDGRVRISTWNGPDLREQPWGNKMALDVDRQGRFTTAFYTDSSTGPVCDATECTIGPLDLHVVRTDADGVTDSQFGNRGEVIVQLGLMESIPIDGTELHEPLEIEIEVGLQRRAFVSHRISGARKSMGVLAFQRNGSLDDSWANSGLLSVGDVIRDMALTDAYLLTVDKSNRGHLRAWEVPAPITRCGGMTPTITGTSADETLDGTPENDVIWGGDGNDVIYGRGGNDVICGGDGEDRLYGGSGTDRIYGQGGPDRIWGQGSKDYIWAGPGDDPWVRGGTGNDEIHGGTGRDILLGDDGSDKIWGDDHGDTIRGGSHGDLLRGGRGFDTIRGGDGPDIIRGGDGKDRLSGGAGKDKLAGNNGRDRLHGGRGSTDSCAGGNGADQVWISCDNFAGHEIGPFTLPFPTEQVWEYSGGPHVSPTSSATPWNGLDFAKIDGKVTAAAPGIAYRISSCHVKVVHASGWKTEYFHLEGIPARITSDGIAVKMGDQVGIASEACPPNEGDHVHFTVWRHGNRINLENIRLDKWKPLNGAAPYTGCLVRTTDGSRRCPGSNVGHNATWKF